MVENIAWIAFRLLFSVVFLNAAWQCGKSAEGRAWTVEESKILFGNAAKFFAPIGILIMGFGGISILFGVLAEIGGALLSGFLLLGTLIHLRHSKNASALLNSLLDTLDDGAESERSEMLQTLATSAQLGHYSSAMKNMSLMGPSVFFTVMGSGPWSVVSLWGLFD